MCGCDNVEFQGAGGGSREEEKDSVGVGSEQERWETVVSRPGSGDPSPRVTTVTVVGHMVCFDDENN